MKKVYIAGPVTGIPNRNKAAFDVAEDVLVGAGYLVVNPLKIVPVEYNDDWEGAMKICLQAMMGCDYVAMLPHWDESIGARFEIDVCKTLGIIHFPVIEFIVRKDHYL